MIVTGNMITMFVNSANQNIEDLGGKTVIAFPDKYFSTPLKQTMYSLGIKKIVVGPRIYRSNNDGTVINTRTRKVEITFQLNVYAPHTLGGDACSKGFDKWIDFIVRTLQYDISEAGCGEVEYDQSIGTNVLKGYFTYSRTVSEISPIT